MMSLFPRQRAHAPRGFTLVELVVVITIIAILAGAVVPTLISPYMHESRAQTMREMSAISEGILGRPSEAQWGYLSHIGAMPDSLDKLLLRPGSWSAGALLDGVHRGWSGPYVQKATTGPTVDAWGSPYVIVTNAGDASQWQLHSYGPNRVPGPAGIGDDDFVLPSLTSWYGSKGTLRTTLVHARDGALGVIHPGWVTAVTLQVPNNNGSSHQPVACGGSEGPAVCQFSDVPLGLHALKIELHVSTGCALSGTCTIYRPVKVLKPLNAVEVVLPNPPDYDWKECGLSAMFTTSIASADCGTDHFTVPPGGHLTVTVSGSLGRVSGSLRCMLAPQILNVSTSGRTPDTLPTVVAPASLAVTSLSDTAPAFTSRTYVNTTGVAVNMRGAAVLASDGAGTDCQFNDGKLIYSLWLP